MEHEVGLFGVAFDPLPSNQALMIKHAYIQAQARGVLPSFDYSDPYAFFSDNLPRSVSGQFRLLGRVSIPTWVQPKPQASDAYELTLGSFIDFMKSGGCRLIADKVRDFMISDVFPSTPGMIGVDHSATYGAISALREQTGENLGLVVIDSHFDAVPMSLRHGLIEHAKETNSPAIPLDLFSETAYPNFSLSEIKEWTELNPENFLLHLLERNLIDPRNLVVVGITDYPPEAFEQSDNPKVRAYLNFFRSLERQGACFIPKSHLLKHGTATLAEALRNLHARHVYVSLDIDVGSLSSVYACRFLTTIGLSLDQIRDVFKVLFSSFSEGRRLAGFDLMEVDIHKLGVKIDSLHVDQTSEVGGLFLELAAEVL
jgi:arginase family enzyme